MTHRLTAPPDEVEELRAHRDCLAAFARAGHRRPACVDDDDAETRSTRRSPRSIEDAVAKAKAAPDPTPDDLLTDVYISY